MSLNWKEINCILEELNLEGSQIQSAVQNSYDTIILGTHKKGETKRILICLGPGVCRIHETFRDFPRPDKTQRFAQFLKSRIVNGWIQEIVQLGDNRIIRIKIRRGEFYYYMYIRLWSNAANFIVTDKEGVILDAMRRLPKKSEVSGGMYPAPDSNETGASFYGTDESPAHNSGAGNSPAAQKKYTIREFLQTRGSIASTPDERSFNRKIDDHYAAQAGSLSPEALRKQAYGICENSIARIDAALEKLRAKEAELNSAEKLREYGDIILSNISNIKPGDSWLEADYPYSAGAAEESSAEYTPGEDKIRIKLDPLKKPPAQAELYYEQYRKAKKGLSSIQAEIKQGEEELAEIKKRLIQILNEQNPLILSRLLKTETTKSGRSSEQDKKRPGLCFRRNDWLIIVGRDAAENDALLRSHVKGNDLWLHARDFAGSYVFIKQRSGKTVPLDTLLDAGNLALFYSKGRNSGGGDLYYTPVKYLRRVKNGPKGRVIPTQEKNLRIELDEKRLKELEKCRIYKI